VSLLKTPAYKSIVTTKTKRIRALITDYTLIGLIISIADIIIIVPDALNTGNYSINKVVLASMIPAALLLFSKDSFNGISPGKWIEGIMVRDANNPGSAPPFRRLFLRNLLLLIWPVEIFLLFSSNRDQRLGDTIAKTIVVDSPVAPKPRPRNIAMVGSIVVVTTFFILFTIGVIKDSEPYKAAVRAIEHNQQVIKETGGIEGYGLIPNGSVGSSRADLEIKVIGNEKNVFVKVTIIKDANQEWHVVEPLQITD